MEGVDGVRGCVEPLSLAFGQTAPLSGEPGAGEWGCGE